MTNSAGLSRRKTLTGLAAVGVGLPVLAACGQDAPGTPSGPADTAGSDPSPEADSGQEAEAGPEGFASTAEVPVGGGAIFAAEKVVVTQPVEGEFKAFSAICTHQSCPFTGVSDTIDCSCHRSAFSITDGSNVAGPNGSPAGSIADLEEIAITVDGDSIRLS